MAVEHAPAKINLALHVRERRDDGHHDLETLFAFTEFGDMLGGEVTDDLSLHIFGEFAAETGGTGDDNLVLRAARALQASAGVQTGAMLVLDKRIPVAAGLGGGSADAAAALRLLDGLWGTACGEAELIEIAATLGADVAACVAGRSCFGSGRGEILGDAPQRTGEAVLLVNPRVALSTAHVFAAWDGVDRGGLDMALPLTASRNDLTAPAVALAPETGKVLDWLESLGGVTLARMSGSGATCLALFDNDALRDAAADACPPQWWKAATSLR